MFRIASITKPFTWTVVMQMVEQGKLDLDADVNEYLDFQIPNTFPQPITIKDLMTHTAGFEDEAYGTYAAQPAAIEPLGQWLAAHIPARVYPPGQVPAYSNYGAVLASYIVERLSGLAWDTYVEQNILKPLGMARATPINRCDWPPGRKLPRPWARPRPRRSMGWTNPCPQRTCPPRPS